MYNFINIGMDCTTPIQSGLFRFVRLNGSSTPIPAPVPLDSVNVTVKLVHILAEVEVTQKFVNKEAQPVEAIYKFPIDSNGALTHFHAEIEDQKIEATLKETKTAAKIVYNESIGGQNTAIMGELEQSDVVKISIGWLKPGSQVKIVLKFLTQLKNVKGSQALQFCLPTTIAPRYAPARFQDSASQELATMVYTDWTNFSFRIPMSIKIDISMPWDISSIKCHEYPVTVIRKGRVSEDSKSWYGALVELSTFKIKEMEKDFFIEPKGAGKNKPKLYLEKLKSSTAIMAHILPSFRLPEQKVELIFVVDQSTSMMGQSVGLARNVLTLLLRSMPPDCYFNIVGFGGSHHKQFSRSRKCDVFNFQQALQATQNMTANQFGTEMLSPLKEIYAAAQIPAHNRQIFLITDGNVVNADEVIGLTRTMTQGLLGTNQELNTRLFTIGVGPVVSHHLIHGLAQAGQGTSIFIGCGDCCEDDWETKVLSQLEDALQPSLKDVKIEWRNGAQKSASFIQDDQLPTVNEVKEAENQKIEKNKTLLGYGKPKIHDDDDAAEIENGAATSSKKRRIQKISQEKFPPIFDGSQLLVFGIFSQPADSSTAVQLPSGLTITAQSIDGPLSLDIELSEAIDFPSTDDQNGDGFLHKMASIKMIHELEQKLASLAFHPWPNFREELELKKEISTIALDEGILTRHTALVCLPTENSVNKSPDLGNDDEKSGKFESSTMSRRIIQATSSRTGWSHRPLFHYSPFTWSTPSPAATTVGGFSSTTTHPSTFGGGRAGSLFGQAASGFSFPPPTGQSVNSTNPPTFSFGIPTLANPSSTLFSVGSHGNADMSSSGGPTLFGSSSSSSGVSSNSVPFGGFGSSSTLAFKSPAPTTTFGFSSPFATGPSQATAFGLSTSADGATNFGGAEGGGTAGLKFGAPPPPTGGTMEPSPFGFKLPAFDLFPSKSGAMKVSELKATNVPSSLEASEMERLKKIISIQSENGSFALTTNFAEAIGLDLDAIKGAKDKTFSDEAWATGVVVSFFEEKLPHKKFFFDSASTKARQWLETMSGVVDLKGLMDKAKVFVEDMDQY